MSEPTTARAMAFRVEDMEREERVEALEQWGEAQREAGRTEERDAHGDLIEKAEAAIVWSNTLRMVPNEMFALHHALDELRGTPGLRPVDFELGEDVTHEFDIRPKPEPDDEWTTNDDLSAPAAEPNVFEQIEQGAWRDPPLTPKPSLVERTDVMLREGSAGGSAYYRMFAAAIDALAAQCEDDSAALLERVAAMGVSIDALTADRKTVFDEFNRLGSKIVALEQIVDSLEITAKP